MQSVWHLLNSDSGGVARYVERLVCAQARLYGPQGSPLRVTGPAGLTLPAGVHHQRYRPARRSWGFNQWRFALWAGVSVRSTDALVHAHSYTIARADVHTAHGLYTEYRRPWIEQNRRRLSPGFITELLQYAMLRWLERRVLATARRVVFVSTRNRRYAENELGLHRSGHFQVILPGVDVEQYSPRLRAERAHWRRTHFPELEAGTRWLLFAGLDFGNKGLLRLLAAIVGASIGQDWCLLVCGEDALNGEAARALARRAPPGRIHFLGRDPRLPQAFQLSDCLLMDSVAEGFPLVLLEAMASGCVPVVTDFSGVSDIVADGVSGVVARDAAAVIQAALSLTPECLSAMSTAAAQAGRRRTWAQVAREYDECYAAVRRGA